MKTIAYKTLSHCIYKYQIHLHGQTFVWAPIEHYSPSQVNIAESAVLCKGIEPPSTEPLAYTLFVIVILWHTWVEDSLYLYCLVLLPFFFFFKLFPILQGFGSRLWVECVGCVGRAVGCQLDCCHVRGDSLAAQWEGSFKDTLLGIELSQCLVQNMNTHTSTHTEEVSKENERVWKGGIQTWDNDVSSLIYNIWHHQSVLSSAHISILS